MSKSIRIRGARQNNLKGIDLDLPLGRFIVVTGPSGSGKSSLAFDTIYAEGQRRYVETFSPYTRQFLDRMDKPLADSIEGIPPAIAIEQTNSVRSTRSTVGTITEINDYLKLFFARAAGATCPECSRPVRPETAQSIVAHVLADFAREQVLVTFGIPVPPGTKPADFYAFLQQQGFLRILLYGEIVRTDEPPTRGALPGIVHVIQDRLEVLPEHLARLSEAIEISLRLGQGKVSIHQVSAEHHQPYSNGWHCAHCDISIRPPSPGLFTFNNPLGACPDCRGFGRIIGIDYARVMPDKSLSISGGVVKPFQSGHSRECQDDLLRAAARNDIDIYAPFEDLPKREQRWVIDGESGVDTGAEELRQTDGWYGVKGYFKWLEARTYKMHIRVLLSRYRSYQPCPACKGGRFQPETLNYRLQPANLTLPALAALPVKQLITVFDEVAMPPGDPSAVLVREQIRARLRYLESVGLGYLSLDRPTRSLSGGEVARVNLTTCLGASLVNALFVMDEPSVGLHPRDTVRLLEVMRALRDKGNTLLVVEHEEAIIRAADHLVDIGPGRGSTGGELTYSGPLSEIRNSLTASYLLGERSIPVPATRREPVDFITLGGIEHHNLHALDIRIPLGVFCCVTGVSGSGKSTLIHNVLYRNLVGGEGDDLESAGRLASIDGGEDIEDIVMVDQSPLARSPRSTPAVYIGSFDGIRQLFAATDDATQAGLTASSFSFNSGNGRCERCAGLGFEKVEMQFLSDLFLRCPECEGRRYQPHVLKIRIGGKSIHDVLEMTVREAIEFFADKERHGEITHPLQLMADVGLGYLRLGQPLNILSGGESQRLKLVNHLVEKRDAGALLIFDEPTTGLHIDDVAQLLRVFQRLVDEGNSLIVIEHNLEVIKSADWIVDLGPEAGDEGGRLVAEGTPEQVARVAASHTGRFLAGSLKGPVGHIEEAPLSYRLSAVHRAPNAISVRGAREHNLKNITLDIPRDQVVVITGMSGSGKSTLAFDILFAEGQRRFLDSMSPYARQFVEQLEKPEVDAIEGLPPSVAIEQRVTRGGGKSTVATVTEIYHFLRLLFSKLGTQYCPDCHLPVVTQTVSAIVAHVEALAKRGRVQLFAPLVKARKGFHTEVARWAERHGYTTLLVDGKLTPVANFEKLERFREHTIDVLIGEISSAAAKDAPKLVRQAIAVGKGTARVVDAKKKSHILSTEMNCPQCERAFEELDPRMFSFNSPHGWCEHCRGFGEVWRHAAGEFESQLEADLAEERSFETLDAGESEPCPVCEGARINAAALAVRVKGHPITDFTRASAARGLERIGKLRFTAAEKPIATDVVTEIEQRLKFLSSVGLDYLSLDRAAKTLSGGESQRIRLAAQLGSNLRGVLYVLDEPTIGLHPRDNDRLLDALVQLARKGNSLVIVEHDEDTMRRADHLIDLGPRAGRNGGEIVAQGSVADVMLHDESLTAKYLREPMRHPLSGTRRDLATAPGWIELAGASLHNLKDVDARFPINRLTVISGISGSGKSSLVRGVLVPAVREGLTRKSKSKHAPKGYLAIGGLEKLGAVLEVDQSPIGKTSRSTPATYIKVLDEIRNVFAQLPEARVRGYTASRFSFNNEGGRCENCIGQGVIKLEMTFLPTTYMPCEECGGKRYNPPTLEVLYNEKSIGDVMEMTVEQASGFFAAHPKIKRSLDLLVETGLGYLQLGQPSPTLSGGEAQRIKLVTQLARRGTAKAEVVRTTRMGKSTLYVLEEPTIGLHTADVANLIAVLHRLVEEGGTVVVIEHHLDVVAEADYVIDIGPEAGEAGGTVVAAGTPEQVA
ncbi:MAG: excinuclease ABC subunit UvrA, partial [Terrimicrobiaceae bacterium]|nr:excinuclease ABC subunit UvrA [Terrimicrobiaceae bacterium]